MTHMKSEPKSLMLLTSAPATGMFINTHVNELKLEHSETEGRHNQEVDAYFAPILLVSTFGIPFLDTIMTTMCV